MTCSEIHRTANRLPMITLASIATALLFFFIPGAGDLFSLKRDALLNGDYFRVISGHWTHWNSHHLFWDVFAFGILGILCESAGRIRYMLCVMGSALAISTTIIFISPTITDYRGLSGIDSALFILAAISMWRDQGIARAVPAMALCTFVGKLVYEFTTGDMLFANADTTNGIPVQPLPISHLIGGMVGAMAGWIPAIKNKGPVKAAFPSLQSVV